MAILQSGAHGVLFEPWEIGRKANVHLEHNATTSDGTSHHGYKSYGHTSLYVGNISLYVRNISLYVGNISHTLCTGRASRATHFVRAGHHGGKFVREVYLASDFKKVIIITSGLLPDSAELADR